MSENVNVTRWGQFSTWMQTRLANWFRNQSNHATGSPSGEWYLCLATIDPATVNRNTTVGQMNEYETSLGYTRLAITYGNPQDALNKINVKNNVSPQFQLNTTPGSPVTVCFISDSPTRGAGNVGAYWKLASPQTPQAGQPFSPPLDSIILNFN